MIDKPCFAPLFSVHPLRGYRAAAAAVVLLALALPCFDLHAELLFRSVEPSDGRQRASPARKYSNPSDTAYARVSPSGAAVPAEEVRVMVSGPITREDMDGAAVMATLLKNGKQKLAGNSVWLASDGGDVDAAMELGRLLRKLGVFTRIGRNDQCLSACVFAFMGGERRAVEGRLGIHRPFFPYTQETADRQARFRHLQRTVRDYIEELDFPPSLYEAVMAVPPESMHMLAPADLKRFYLEGISPSSEDSADAAAARRLNLSMFEYLRRKARAPECVFPAAGQKSCEGTTLEAAISGGAADDPGSLQKNDAGRALAGSTGVTTKNRQSPEAPRGTTRGVH